MDTDKIISDSKNYGPRYHNAVCDLLKKANEVDVKEKLSFFEEFARKYTVIPSLWLYWYITESQCETATKTSMKNKHFDSIELDQHLSILNYKTAYHNMTKHYYMDYNTVDLMNTLNPLDSQTMIRKLLNHDDIRFLRQMLHLPHLGMEVLSDIFNKYVTDMDSNCPLGEKFAKKYKTAFNLLETLKIIERNEELWMKYLKECDDTEFIITSSEYRLGINSENKEFWFCYLPYLKECGNTEMLLKTYSRYCKLFLDDKSLHEKWYIEIAEARTANKLKWWAEFVTTMETVKNPEYCKAKMNEILLINYGIPEGWCSPEDNFDAIFSTFVALIKENEPSSDNNVISDVKILPTSIPTTLTPAIQQLFALPKDTIEHIAKTASPLLLLKLQTTCKYFWYKNDVIYCHRLVYDFPMAQLTYAENSLIIASKDADKITAKNYHLGHSLLMNTVNANQKLLISNLIKQLHSCRLQYLRIAGQKLTLKEFEFLASTKTLISVYLHNIAVEKSDNEMAKFDDIFEFLPNVTCFILSGSHEIQYTANTAQKLAALSRNAKLTHFSIFRLPNDLDPKELAHFIKKNVAAEASFTLSWTDKEFEVAAKSIINNIVFDDNEFEEEKLKIKFGGNF